VITFKTLYWVAIAFYFKQQRKLINKINNKSGLMISDKLSLITKKLIWHHPYQ